MYFLDLISDVKLLEDPASDTLTQAQIQALKPSDYLYSAHEIFRGKPELCTFEADWHLMTDIVNDFGKTAHLSSGSQTKVTIEIMIQPEAMKAWAMRHAPLVKILSPAYLVKEVREARLNWPPLWTSMKIAMIVIGVLLLVILVLLIPIRYRFSFEKWKAQVTVKAFFGLFKKRYPSREKRKRKRMIMKTRVWKRKKSGR